MDAGFDSASEKDRHERGLQPGDPPLALKRGAVDGVRQTTGAGYGAGYGAGAGYGMEAAEAIHLTDYLKVLYKRRWPALTAFVLVVGGVALHTFTATPVYQSTVQLLIDSQTPNVVDVEEVMQSNQRTQEFNQTQYRLLRSRRLARQVLEAENLWKSPHLAASLSSGVPLNPLAWAGAAVSGVRRLFGGETAAQRETSETADQTRAVNRILAALTITPIRNSQLVDVTVASVNPDFAAQVANALAREYIEQNLEVRFNATREANTFIEKRLAEQRQSVEASELALQRYREKSNSISLEEREDIVIQRLADLNREVTRAGSDRINKEAVYLQVRDLQNDKAALDTVPAVLANPYIQGLRTQLGDLQRRRAGLSEKFGDKMPEMVTLQADIQTTERKLEAEIAKLVIGLRNDYETAAAQERSLQAALRQQTSEAMSLSRQAIDYGVLQRDATSNQEMFKGLLQRAQETDIAGDARITGIRVIDPAEASRRPARPNKASNLALGLLFGTLMGVGLAFFFEYVDGRIKSPAEIRTQLGLPFLGLIPAIDKTSGSTGLLIHDGVPDHFSEAFRTLRTNVLFGTADAGPKTVLVTSTAPGEGKSMVSANLAISLAMAGQRVVLIDADMRRPRVHELFDTGAEPGLSNVLVADSKASDSVRRTPVTGLWVMPAGHRPPNPAELLGSRRFREILGSFNEHFDWIVIDSPPIMAVTDAAVIAHLATGVVFVLGSEMTHRAAAKSALERLDLAKAKYLGAVLNRVDLKRNSYYYSQYYRREYAEYYKKDATA